MLQRMRIFCIVLFSILAVLGIAAAIIAKNTLFFSFPALKGEPETGKWYEVKVDEAKSADGSDWYGIFRKGSENKVAVYFLGGGVGVSKEASEQAKEFFTTNMFAQDFVVQGGISSDDEENPFKDWTFVVIPYSTGDFHIGAGEYRFQEKNKEKVVYYNGYNNYSLYMDRIREYVGAPDTLLVTGYSAGGVGASFLADDVMERFPSAKNVTVCVDSALLLYDGWHETVAELWKSPGEISERVTSDNIVLDSLVSLYEKQGDNIKLLFGCSCRDETLQQYQSYIDSGTINRTKELGDQFQDNLSELVEKLQAAIPDIGIFIWNYGADADTGNTQSGMLVRNLFEELDQGKSVGDWILDAVNGEVESYGLELL